jgi:hypothetical protein
MDIQWSCNIPAATITRFCRDTNVATPLHFELPGVFVGAAHDGQGFQELLELFGFGAGEERLANSAAVTWWPMDWRACSVARMRSGWELLAAACGATDLGNRLCVCRSPIDPLSNFGTSKSTQPYQRGRASITGLRLKLRKFM